MSAVDSNFYKKKKGSIFYVAIGFLVFTIVGTGALYFFTSNLQSENIALNEEITGFETRIEDERSDKNVQIYSIYEKHKGLLGNIAKRSEIPLFVSHLKKNFQKYGVEGKGFDYKDGVVSIEIESETGDSEYAYQKIVKVLREYEQDEKALFEIGKITNFSGHDEISFSSEFRLK